MLRRLFSFAALSVAGLLAIVVSAWSQSKDSHGAQMVKEMKFEILAIRPTQPGPSGGNWGYTPGGFVWRARMWDALEFAFIGEDTTQWNFTYIANAPKWAYEETYEFNARVAQADVTAWQSQKHYNLLRSALRNALKERCKLVIHEEAVSGENWELIVGRHAPKLKDAVPGDIPPIAVKLLSGGFMTPIETRANGGSRRATNWKFFGATMDDLAHFLSMSGRPVRNKTGLTGRYDFTMTIIPEPVYGSPDTVFNYPVEPLGLTLKRGKEIRSRYVIDQIQRPTPN